MHSRLEKGPVSLTGQGLPLRCLEGAFSNTCLQPKAWRSELLLVSLDSPFSFPSAQERAWLSWGPQACAARVQGSCL